VVRDGSPVTALLAVAEDEGADLIVVGSRGLGGYPEQLLGSTSTQVAQHAPCPVAIVPTG
jgi:nucleotide-binding universal stress UspA family protein